MIALRSCFIYVQVYISIQRKEKKWNCSKLYHRYFHNSFYKLYLVQWKFERTKTSVKANKEEQLKQMVQRTSFHLLFKDHCLTCTESCQFIRGNSFQRFSSFWQCFPEASKTRRDAEVMQSNDLIETNPQREGKVYTRCFCLEESQGMQVRNRHDL